eukprot:11161213-Lingulodinium_polyedra.AAC.1
MNGHAPQPLLRLMDDVHVEAEGGGPHGADADEMMLEELLEQLLDQELMEAVEAPAVPEGGGGGAGDAIVVAGEPEEAILQLEPLDGRRRQWCRDHPWGPFQFAWKQVTAKVPHG